MRAFKINKKYSNTTLPFSSRHISTPPVPTLSPSPSVSTRLRHSHRRHVVGGIPEEVQDGITGYLTPPGDAEAMAGRVVELLENDNLREKMGEQAAEDARKRFDIERMAGEYLRWYGKIIYE